MNTEVKQLNIPNMDVESVITKLEELYTPVICTGTPFSTIPTPFFWGPAGVGKSNGVFQLAKRLEGSTGKRVNVTDVRLLLFSPIDLRGVPVADSEKRFTNWLMPKVFDMDTSNDCVNILFLDELSAAPQSVQAAAYQICLDRKIGEFILPDNCIVVAAGNRTTDQSVSYKMPKALCNRLMHFNVISSFVAWRKWAVKNGISDMIIAFLAFDNSRLCVEPESSDLAYATPRSWEFVSNILKSTGKSVTELYEVIAACIGNDNALEFDAFCKGCAHIPSIDGIIAGKVYELPRTHDVMFATVSSLVAAVRDRCDELTIDELDNVFVYVFRLPGDFAVMFMKDIIDIEGINGKLMKSNRVQQWLSRNKKFI